MRFIMGTAKYRRKGLQMEEAYPTRRNCGALVEHRRLLTEDPSYVAARSEIENSARAYERGFRVPARVGITRIPVVVHVVWNTQAQNISDAQIQSQIDVLNRDFRKTNPDVAQVPQVWQSLVADARIEFFLATTDPNGNTTTGITRTQTQTTSFSQQGNPVKSAATGGADPWPANRYLNIWVCQLSGGLLGYAQFPGGPAQTDGVVILHSGFGTTGTAAAPFDRGRTATHEIGHWVNLFHIWGDDGTGCNGTDEVADTPNQADENYGCPTFPSISCNNGPNGDMFMNYMDYTDDACMYMFTAGQVARIQAALDGPRSSIGAQTAWTNPIQVPGWFGSEDQGGGVAITDINGNGRPDLIVFHIDNPSGENHGYYRIGWNLDTNGNVSGSWTNPIQVPGWFGSEDQGGGIAVADINGNGRPDLVVFHIDNPGGDNHGYYRVGWNLDTNGNVTGGWSNAVQVPGWFGWENQGGGVAIADVNANGRSDLIVFHIDNPSGENHGYYRVGFDLF
jgi:hypothetical protein